MLRRTVIAGVAAAALVIGNALVPTFAQEVVPYAFRPSLADFYVPTLGDVMGAMQLRHFKLWHAGKSKTGIWQPTKWARSKTPSPTPRDFIDIPVEKINMIVQPTMALQSAIDAKDGKHFADAFDNLTAACNAYHEAAKVGFIAIKVPTASPFSNQSFAPKRK